MYVCFAFVALELNPLLWDGVTRAFFVFTLAIANCLGLWIICELQNKEEDGIKDKMANGRAERKR